MQSGKSDTGHKHAASDITSGILGVANGGTGATSAANARSNLEAAGLSSTVTVTLSSSSWSGSSAPYTYSLTVSGVTTTSNQEILPTVDIASSQLEALQKANIIDGGQSTNTITLLAYGDKPEVDIPIRVIKRGD